MLTYITTCYNDFQYLDQLEETMEYCKDERLKMIIVDDCSDQPIDPIVRAWDDPRVSLYRITDDLGFNSHGARNLAMKETTTEWNVLIDIDYRLIGVDALLEMLDNKELEPNIPHFFPVSHSYDGRLTPTRASINDFVVTSKLFWKAKGYDPEYYGIHYGDREFITRMSTQHPQFASSLLVGSHLDGLRSPLATIFVDSSIGPNEEVFNEDRSILSIGSDVRDTLRYRMYQCRNRHENNTQINYLPFNWIKQI
jgi:glycosyltransferase involved in cell wall biosynthesis